MNLLVQELINGIVSGAVYILIAVGLSLIFGVLRVVNFAHGEFYMIGGFTTYILTTSIGLPYIVTVLVAGVAGFVLGALAERITVRPLRKAPEDAVFLSTFGLSLVLLYAVKMLLGNEPKPVTSSFSGQLAVAGLTVSTQQVFAVGVCALLVGVLMWLLHRSPWGLVIRAVAQDRDSAGLMGVDVDRVYWVTFAIAGAMAALAGASVAPIFSVNPFSGQDVLIRAFIIVIAAGMGSVPGAVVVGLCLGIAESLAAGYLPNGSREFVGYALVLLVLLVRPYGLFGSPSEQRS